MIHQIILSTNEDRTYMEFWKPVAWAYKKLFPDVTVHLAFLTNRAEDDDLVEDFRQHGKVTLFKPVPDVPEFGQAKMIRFILAGEQGSAVCYIDDIDLFPLRKDFITGKVSQRPQGHLLCVGGEVYDNNGCYPISQHTAEGYVWKAFINPDNLDYRGLMDKWTNNIKYDRRENICIETDFKKDNYFSDERLIRRLIFENPVLKFEMERGYVHFMDATIDRYKWNVDLDKLKNHGYQNAHGIRPYGQYVKEYAPLMEYINENYK